MKVSRLLTTCVLVSVVVLARAVPRAAAAQEPHSPLPSAAPTVAAGEDRSLSVSVNGACVSGVLGGSLVTLSDNVGLFSRCSLFGQHGTEISGSTTTDTAQLATNTSQAAASNGSVGIVDRWRCASGDECYDRAYDFDGDRDIDIVDIMAMVSQRSSDCGDRMCLSQPPSAVRTAEATSPMKPTVVVRFDPSSMAVLPGERFTMAVNAEGVVDLGGFKIEMSCDPAVVQVDGAVLGDLLGSTGRSVSIVGPDIDKFSSTLRFGGFSSGDQPGPSGEGVLAEVTFMARGPGASPLTLEQVQVADTRGKPMMVTVEHGLVLVGLTRRVHLPLQVVGMASQTEASPVEDRGDRVRRRRRFTLQEEGKQRERASPG